MPYDSAHRPVMVEGRVLPKALINARAATRHPHNCMDLRKGGRRALSAILAFFNLKTRAAIFPSRDVLAMEAGISVQTLHRDLAELEAREYIVRKPQKHKSAAAGYNAGKFWIAPIELTKKALVLLGLEQVIHSEPHLKMRDGVYIDKEHTKEEQSSLKNTVPQGNPDKNDRTQSNDIDRETKLPKDLLPVLERGVSRSGIFLLMKLAGINGKRLSDVVACRMTRIEALRLRGRALFSYLRQLIAANVDFAFLASGVRNAKHQAEDEQEAKALQQRLHRHCDGFEIRKGDRIIGIFHAAPDPADCGWVETPGGTLPLNLNTALAMLRSGISVGSPDAYSA